MTHHSQMMAYNQAAERQAVECRVLRFLKDPSSGGFEMLVLDLHRFQRGANPHFGRFCGAYPEPKSWREIPCVPQEGFKQFALRSFAPEETIRTFRTSGTTGQQYGEHHFRTLELYRIAAIRGWIMADLACDKVFALVPHPDEAPHSSLSQMAAWLAPPEAFFVRGGKGIWGALREAARAATTPVCLFGTALAFLDLFEWLGQSRLDLPAGSTAVETGGYKGSRRNMPKRELYELFAERLGLGSQNVVNEYGMTELSSQFYARGVGSPHRHPPWARGLVVDPQTGREVAEGEPGILRLFDAANTGSVCAIQTEDLAIRRGEDFELIGRDPAALPRGCSRAADEALSAPSR